MMANTTLLIFNIFCLAAAIGLIVLKRPKIKEIQMYVYEREKPTDYLFLIGIWIIIFLILSNLFSMGLKADISTNFVVKNAGKGISNSSPYDTSKPGTKKVSFIWQDDAGNEADYAYNVHVVEQVPNKVPKASNKVITKGFNKDNPAEELKVLIARELKPYWDSDPGLDAKTKYQDIYFGVGEQVAYSEIPVRAETVVTDKMAIAPKFIANINTNIPNKFWASPIKFIAPSLFMATLLFHFWFYNKKIVKTYVTELYTINKFCGFLTYNLTYRNNSKVLIEETLSSIEDCQFSRDFATIFFEKGIPMGEKLSNIAEIYNYKFFEMYLSIAQIIFEEGVSRETLKSLAIIQALGDDYYDKIDLFFRAKKGAMGQITMIIVIGSIIPFMIKNSVGDMLLTYFASDSGYMFMMVFYTIQIGIFIKISRIYKDNKLIRKEGRYV